MYRQFLTLSLLIGFSIAAFPQQKRFTFTRSKMGSPFTIIFFHGDSTYANAIAGQAFDLVDSLVNIYSNYIPVSELNRLSDAAGSGKYVKVSPAMLDLLLHSRLAYRRSHHSFDITIGPLTDLWRKARKEHIFPAQQLVEKSHGLVGFEKVNINRRKGTAKLQKAGMRLDPGGIAQGYIAQKVAGFLRDASIKSMLIDVSGDIAMGDPPPGKTGWMLGVNLPDNGDRIQEKKLTVSNCSVSTSGDVYQFFSYNGKRYSHIVDPRTGYGITEGKNVTVIAKDATIADWLATACSILSIKKAKKLARRMDAEVLVAWIQSGSIKVESTNGFNKYWK